MGNICVHDSCNMGNHGSWQDAGLVMLDPGPLVIPVHPRHMTSFRKDPSCRVGDAALWGPRPGHRACNISESQDLTLPHRAMGTFLSDLFHVNTWQNFWWNSLASASLECQQVFTRAGRVSIAAGRQLFVWWCLLLESDSKNWHFVSVVVYVSPKFVEFVLGEHSPVN